MVWVLASGFVVLSALYLGAVALYLGHFIHGESWNPRYTSVGMAALVAVHALLLVAVGKAYQEFPLVGMETVFSVLALSLVVVYLLLEIRFRVKTTGVFILAAAALFHFLSRPMITAHPRIVPILQNPTFGVHVVLAILGYTSFFVSVIYGGLYLALYRSIKRKKFGLAFQRIPALDLLSRMNAHSAITGFGFLTVSILLGILLSRHLNLAFLRDPTFIQSAATWLGYGLFVLVYYGMSWRGLRQVYCSMGSFALALVSVSVVLFSFRAFHTFN